MKEIGLKRGTVELKMHHKKWKDEFEKEKKMLMKKIPVIIEINHGGSTSIPDLPAKPIIDMFAGVKSLKDAEKLKTELEKLNYEYHGEDGVQGRVLYTKGQGDTRTHHLHFIKFGSKEWKNNIFIKEYLLKYPEKAKEYAKLKKSLAKQFSKDREKYTQGKDKFIKSIIKSRITD